VAEWTKAGHELPGHPLPAYRVSCDFPLAAVVGVMKPRLVLSESLLRELDPAEVRAVVEHEVAHAGVRENLRRLALRASPDLLALLPAGARLRELFDHASEAAADRVASTRVPPLVLAHALLKTAALVPAGQRLDLSLAAFHREGGIAARVFALLEPGAGRPERRSGFRLGLALALVAGLLLVVGQAESAFVHGALEGLVHLFA
jgi:beta-lactamase regulating signal transducer with metallopeptidase domain